MGPDFGAFLVQVYERTFIWRPYFLTTSFSLILARLPDYKSLLNCLIIPTAGPSYFSGTMLSSVRRHSLRLQTELHRWSICDPGSHLLPDRLLARVPVCISRSKSCTSSTGESDGSPGSWSSADSVISTDSSGEAAEPGSPYRVVLLGGSGVGKTAFARIFAGAADSMDSDDCELYGGEKTLYCCHCHICLIE